MNQYTARTVPGFGDILGSATNTASVTVNDQLAYRRGNYYRAELTVSNAVAPVWLALTNLAERNSGANPDIIPTNIVKG